MFVCEKQNNVSAKTHFFSEGTRREREREKERKNQNHECLTR